jgi:uncharacterized protein
MVDGDFDWDPVKARRNYNRHSVTFETARKAFADPFAVEILDDHKNFGEESIRGTSQSFNLPLACFIISKIGK